ncbi:MAG: ice-binding family protein [bacterium]|nr:ice-binding family protein [bacterium]
MFGLIGPIVALAATTPSLGTAASYGVLSSTYTNTTAGTTINGDVGFTTGSAVAPAGAHTNYGSGAPYATAGVDQGSALSALASQACTFTFGGGAIDFSTDTTHGAVGVYTPGVYCTSGAASIGTGGITLSGSGTYIFRVGGALTTVANSAVTLAGGASACDVFWTPTSATTLAANTTFAGTVIDAAGITVGANTTWSGKALAFGGTVTTDMDTITVPTCTVTPPPAPALATLHVIKQVVNNNGGTATAATFNLHVKLSGADVTGSPAVGTATPGTSHSLVAGTYVVSEDVNVSYTQSFSGDCNSSGSVTLSAGVDKTCTITNDDIAVVPTPTPTPTPLLPNTGIGPDDNNSAPWNIIIPTGIFVALFSFYLVRKKWAI